MFGFNDDISAWQYFRQLLVDGFIAFEIVYDDKGRNVIGFKEIDATTIMPSVEKQKDGSEKVIREKQIGPIHIREEENVNKKK
jgi:hypothetical protein